MSGNTARNVVDVGIVASGTVTGNYSIGNGTGINAFGTVRGNTALNNQLDGIFAGAGSAVIGNTANDNGIGLRVGCPSNLTDNTATFNGANLVLTSADCHNEDNVAP